MSGVTTDSAVLTTEAGTFDQISTSLKSVMAQIDGTAGAMHGHLQGAAGIAAQAAFVRYQEAAQVQKAALDEISMNLNSGGHQYDGTDQDQSAALGQTVQVPSIGL